MQSIPVKDCSCFHILWDQTVVVLSLPSFHSFYRSEGLRALWRTSFILCRSTQMKPLCEETCSPAARTHSGALKNWMQFVLSWVCEMWCVSSTGHSSGGFHTGPSSVHVCQNNLSKHVPHIHESAVWNFVEDGASLKTITGAGMWGGVSRRRRHSGEEKCLSVWKTVTETLSFAWMWKSMTLGEVISVCLILKHRYGSSIKPPLSSRSRAHTPSKSISVLTKQKTPVLIKNVKPYFLKSIQNPNVSFLSLCILRLCFLSPTHHLNCFYFSCLYIYFI